METTRSPPPDGGGAGRRCSCACRCCCSSSSDLPRSVKRKLDDLEAAPAVAAADVARVEVESEAVALREALAGSQQSVQELYAELDAERSFSASAASEAMSMILRLQREKAEALMEARQFKRFSEEKMAHDQQELAALDDLLFSRDQALQSLSFELQAYRHRLLSSGIMPDPAPAPASNDTPLCDIDYPPLRCGMAHPDFDPNTEDDIDVYNDIADLQTERDREDLKTLEHRVHQLETAVTTSSSHAVTEEVIAGQSPLQRMHSYSSGSSTYIAREPVPKFLEEEEFPVMVDRESDDAEADDVSDRVYTIDTVHGVPVAPVCEDECASMPGESLGEDVKYAMGGGVEIEEGDIKNLYSRLQALEADRESMRQALITMRTEKAQLMLLREIAQQLCKEVKPEDYVGNKPSSTVSFSFELLFKWIMSFLLLRRKATKSKYTFGLSRHNAGLLLLLDKSGQWRCLTRTRR